MLENSEKNPIAKLENRIAKLEQEIELLKDTSINRKFIAGENYISRIVEGSEYLETFFYPNGNCNFHKYIIKLDNCIDTFTMIVPEHFRQPKVGDYINHKILDGTRIKDFYYIEGDKH
jgi:hypothetical protein